MAKKTLLQMCEELYDDPDIRAAIVADAGRAGTVAAIEKGLATLPTVQDAIHWHNRITGRINETEVEQVQRKRIDALEKAFSSLTEHLGVPDQAFAEKLKAELAAAGK